MVYNGVYYHKKPIIIVIARRDVFLILFTGISNSSSDIHATATASSLAMTSFGIPLTGSMSAAVFTIGFIKG
jgi:hypothetical protein